MGFGNCHPYNCSSPFPGSDGEAVYLHLQSFPDICQGDMGPVAACGGVGPGQAFLRQEAWAVVLHGDLAAGGCPPGADGDVQGGALRVQAVLDGIFHYGLEGQGRQAEFLVGVSYSTNSLSSNCTCSTAR